MCYGKSVSTVAGASLETERTPKVIPYDGICAQANTTIASDATQRVEAFTDVDVNLSGKAAAVLGGPAEAATPTANGHAAPQVDRRPNECIFGLKV